jgi:RNA 3'-terminal phosphate cyclase (ATP)
MVQVVSTATADLPAHIVERQAVQTAERLREAGLRNTVEQQRPGSASPGTYVFLRAVCERSVAGFWSLGKLGKPAERVADEAVDELLAFLDAPGALDPHAADQLMTLLALSPEPSELATTAVTEHQRTNAEVIRRITGRDVTVKGEIGRPGRIVIE